MRWWLGIVFALAATQVHAGVLNKVRDEVRNDSDSSSSDDDDDDAPKRKKSSDSSSSSDTSASTSSSDSDSAVGSAVTRMVVELVLAPWRWPYLLVEGEQPNTYVFLDHPYAKRQQGALAAKPREGDVETPAPKATQNMALQAGVDSGLAGNNLSRTTISTRLQLPYRLQIDTTWSAYLECLSPKVVDALVLGRAHLGYRFAPNEYVQFHTGLGMNVLVDGVGTELGFDFDYGADIFVARPIIISLDGGLGALGRAFVARGRATLGAAWRAMELLGGYEVTRIGEVTLHGPLLGLRVWW